MCFFEETQSGSNRDLVGTQSGTNFRVFGTTFGPVGKMATQKRAKTIKNTAKSCFLWIWLPPDIGARLDADCMPTGSRLAKSGAQKCKNWCPTGSRRDPDKIPTLSIDRQEPTPAPIFPFPDPPLPLFSFPRTSRAPIPPPPAPKRQKQS